MREIAASSDFDFVAAEPRRAKPRGRKAAKTRITPAWLTSLWRYRTPVVAVSALCLLLGAVVVNAMFLQSQRHPAPLFGATFRIAAPTPAAQPAPRPGSIDALLADKLPDAKLAPLGTPPDDALTASPVAVPRAAPEHAAAPVAPAAVARPAAPAHVARAVPVKKKPDAIGALLSGGEKPAAAAPTARVANAQRALQKIGMVVAADGRMNPGTRKAIQLFQRDNGLPATGELNAATREQMSAQSGVAVE